MTEFVELVRLALNNIDLGTALVVALMWSWTAKRWKSLESRVDRLETAIGLQSPPEPCPPVVDPALIQVVVSELVKRVKPDADKTEDQK